MQSIRRAFVDLYRGSHRRLPQPGESAEADALLDDPSDAEPIAEAPTPVRDSSPHAIEVGAPSGRAAHPAPCKDSPAPIAPPIPASPSACEVIGAAPLQPLRSADPPLATLNPFTKVKRARPTRVIESLLRRRRSQWKALAEGLVGQHSAGLRTLAIAQSAGGEGCTTVAVALALSLARHTRLRVLLIDGSFANPGVARALGLCVTRGLERPLLERTPFEDALVEIEAPALAVAPLACGVAGPKLFGADRRIAHVIDIARACFDLTVIDAGVLPLGEPEPTNPGIDAALLVRRPTRCNSELHLQGAACLERAGVASLGVIENSMQ